jgi:hypothetical protein
MLMDTLADDLVLLSIDPRTGKLLARRRIAVALMGAELAQLAWYQRIRPEGSRIAVISPAPGGSAELDSALAALAAARRPPRLVSWVARPRPGILAAYLGRLSAAGVITAERRGLGRTRWRFAGPQPADAALARLDAIARSAGPATELQAAFGGLAHGCGLGALLYPGWANRDARRRLAQLSGQHWAAQAVIKAVRAQDAATAQATQVHIPPQF